MLKGDALTCVESRQLLEDKEKENWRLRVQVAHLQGERIGKGRRGRCTLQVPTRRQSAAANKQSRRTLQRVEAHLFAIWEEVEGEDAEWWCVEGFENLIFTLIRRSLPGSGAKTDQRWLTKRILHQLYDDPHCRHWLEKIRAQTKIWTPNEFNVAQRQGHAGQRAWRASRKFMCRQMYSVDTLRSSKQESKAYAHLWNPIGEGFDEPVDAEEAGSAAAAAAAAARSLKSMAREEQERKLLRNRAEKDLAKSEEAEAERLKVSEGTELYGTVRNCTELYGTVRWCALPSAPIHSHPLPSAPIRSHPLPSAPIRSHPLPSTPVHSRTLPVRRARLQTGVRPHARPIGEGGVRGGGW